MMCWKKNDEERWKCRCSHPHYYYDDGDDRKTSLLAAVRALHHCYGFDLAAEAMYGENCTPLHTFLTHPLTPPLLYWLVHRLVITRRRFDADEVTMAHWPKQVLGNAIRCFENREWATSIQSEKIMTSPTYFHLRAVEWRGAVV